MRPSLGRLLPLLLLAAAASPLRAQQGACATGNCRLGVRTAEGVVAGIMRAAAGGNPWMGSASTLGFRTVTFPRIGAQVRTGFTGMDVPGRMGEGDRGTTAIAVTGGLSMAILDGISPAATVGGLGSVDIFGNAGVVFLPGDAGFGTGSPFTWSIGARVGIFRESFTLPGVTASLAYRGVGNVDFDRAAVLQRDAGFSWGSASAWQARAVVGKQLSAFAFSGGFGWDGSSADAAIASRSASGTVVTDPVPVDADRYQAFVGATWTSLILSLAAEAGWQFGAREDDALSGRNDPAAGGRAFGALGVRVTF